MKEYKTEVEFKNVDFNADVVALYSCIREKLTVTFSAAAFKIIHKTKWNLAKAHKKEIITDSIFAFCPPFYSKIAAKISKPVFRPSKSTS